MQPVFITGIGTDVGKTVVAAIVAEALGVDYWKPVQAGFSDGTDSTWIETMVTTKVHTESYELIKAASPHIAAREEGIIISTDRILADFNNMDREKGIVIEGAGGLLVPLNNEELVIDLIKKLDAQVILVSRNYLGSINHSLLTAQVCRQHSLKVAGWIFNGSYLNYEEEIAGWSGYPLIAKIPDEPVINREFIHGQASLVRNKLKEALC